MMNTAWNGARSKKYHTRHDHTGGRNAAGIMQRGGENMINILVYDHDGEKLEELAEENNTTPAEIIEALLDMIKTEEINISDYV